MNRFKVALKVCELACINFKLLHLYMNIYREVGESQGKFSLKSQGFLSDNIAGNPDVGEKQTKNKVVTNICQIPLLFCFCCLHFPK